MAIDQNREYVLKLAHDSNVKFIRLWFTDILGFLKSFAITIDELEDAITEGVRFDGSTLHGFIRSDEREMIALPDVSTFKILPWRPKEDSVARMICDIHQMDMTPYEGDSRFILKRNLQKAAAKGYTFYIGPEIEFFYFKNSSQPEILDRGGYFDLTPLDIATDYRRDTVLTLEKMDIDVISSHHEASHSQHEIDLRHEDALTMADNIMTFRLITKEIALLNNIYASFMPKPLASQNGSGLHIHQSLFKDDKNIFFDKNNSIVPLKNSRALHRRPAHALQRVLRAHQPVDQLVQASPQGLRVADARDLEQHQPQRARAGAAVQARQAERHAHRAAEPGSGLQPVPGLLRDPGGRASRGSTKSTSWATRWRIVDGKDPMMGPTSRTCRRSSRRRCRTSRQAPS